MATGITLRLYDTSGAALTSLTGLSCLWWDETAPASFEHPLGRSSVGETDGSGDLILDLTGVTSLTSGQAGFLMVYRLDETDHKDSLTFAGQVEVGTITSGVDMYSMGDWARPSDWLPLPAVSDSEHKVLLLHRVEDGADNYIALSAASNYTVDWGDGSTPENFSSGATASHQYSFADTDLAGTELADGAKQAIITITPQATYSLTSLDLHKRHASAAVGHYASGIMDVVISGPLLTTLYLGRSSASASVRLVNYPWLEQVSLYAPTLTALTHLFRGLPSFAKLARFDTGTITNASYTFYNCSSLQSLPSGMTLSAVTNASSTFQNCASLQSIPSGMTLAAVTNATNLFTTCPSLQSAPGLAIPVSFSVAWCNFAAAQLDEIYTSLPTVSGQTITVTSNPGTTGDTPSIATAKGWTVSGS